jgi:hypothetical protein
VVFKLGITELIKNPVIIKDELARTKTQLEAEFVFEQDRLSTQSYYLGMLATSGKQSGNHKYWEPVTVRKTQDFTLAVLVPLGISDVYIGLTSSML